MFYLKSFLSNLLDSCWASKIDLFIISQVAKRYRFYKPFLLTGTCGTNYYKSANIIIPGSCCGSVGRAVAFDTRGPRFKSSHFSNIALIRFLGIPHLTNYRYFFMADYISRMFLNARSITSLLCLSPMSVCPCLHSCHLCLFPSFSLSLRMHFSESLIKALFCPLS